MGFFSLLGLDGCCQSMVKSKSYDLMLQGLLKEKVPFVSVDSLEKADTAAYVLLDTRSREEYEVSHIPGAVWVGPQFDPEELPDLSEDRSVITYCSVGKRSENYGAELAAFSDSLRVKNLYGGIFEWVNQGNEIRNDGKATDSIHAFSKSWGIWLKKGEKVYEPKPGQKASR